MSHHRASLSSRVRPRALAVLALAGVALGAPAAVTAGPVVRHLYALAGQSPVRVIPFDIDAAGQITARTDQAVVTATGASSLLVAPDAKTIYVGVEDSFGA
jgi:hypothetical protein